MVFQWCNQIGCDTKIIFARVAGTDRRIPLEARDRETFSTDATGALVVVAGEAWKPRDLIEHFQTRLGGISEEKARDLVAGYPSHRPHGHDRDEQAPEPTGDTTGAGEAIADVLRGVRFSYSSEDQLQRGIASAFNRAGLVFRREVKLSDADRIDFLVGSTGVEVKVTGSVDNVTRQLARYAAHDSVRELVLVTTVARHDTIPRVIAGVSVRVAFVRGAAW